MRASPQGQIRGRLRRWLGWKPDPSQDPAPHLSWQRRIPWGIAWGAGWATILNLTAASPLLVQLESEAQRWAFVWRGPQPAAPEIVIVGIDGQVENRSRGQTVDFLLERPNYAALTLRLLEEAEARVVVLNLPSSFVVPQTLGNEDLDAPLRQVVQRYADRLVLATRSSESFRQSEISIYNHFLPFSSLQLEYLVPPEHVQAVVQYQLDPAGILRYAQLRGRFIRRDSQTVQGFAFVEALTLAKFDPERASRLFAKVLDKRRTFPDSGQSELLQFNPLGPSGQIPIVPIEQICPPGPVDPCLGPTDPAVLQQLRGKIVLVGFVAGYPETFPVRTAYGSQISAVELQGQVLSSLLTNHVYQRLPGWAVSLLVQILCICVGITLALGSRRWGWIVPLLGLSLYKAGSLSAFLLWRATLPLTLPVVGGGLTAISVSLTLVLLHNRERLQMQQAELERLRRAEQEAVIDQARKLLYRVATDIHDQELQELKLVMDELETMQWQQQPPLSPTFDHLLQQLEQIGRGIRDQLNDVRILATKLRISPSLREGLHQGIHTYLDTVVEGGILTLPLRRDLQPLQEANVSEWLDAREDILRFVREAIANVISHVQPPRGSATFVTISLSQQGKDCHLEVSNDGTQISPGRKGGYGTKAMNTIARSLPKGSWQRTHTPDGHTHVELRWQMPDPAQKPL